jgi:hypothetical protein
MHTSKLYACIIFLLIDDITTELKLRLRAGVRDYLVYMGHFALVMLDRLLFPLDQILRHQV